MRDVGFYWVRYNGNWHIAKYHITPLGDMLWFMTGDRFAHAETDFTEIDERPIVREEPKHPNYTGFGGTVDRIPQNE